MSASGSLQEALQRARDLAAEQPGKSARQAAAILEAVPGHPEALLLLGAAWRRLGQLEQARDLLTRLAHAQPRAAAAQLELGATQAALGDLPAGIAALRRALALNPHDAAAWRMLGDALAQSGEPAMAEQAYLRQINEAVHDPVLMQAADALHRQDLPQAEKLLRARLVQAPTDAAALRMLAEAGTRLGQNRDAESLLARCLALVPSFTPARYNRAVVLVREREAETALPEVERLLAEAPNDARYLSLRASCLAILGEYERAIETYRAILKDHPSDAKMWLSMGHALKTLGQRAEAVAAYRTATQLAPNLGEAYWSLANLKTEAFTPDEIAAMRDLLARDDIAAEDRFHLDYALGRAFEQAGAYAVSFAHYSAGAALRRREITYSADRTTEQLQRTRALMTRAFFDARAAGGHDDPAPIFIVGLPRAGSTLIEQILSSHSQVEGTMELPELARLSRELGRSGTAGPDIYPESLTDVDEAARAELGQRFIKRTRAQRKTDKPLFIDKMPNNFVHIGLIRLILPRAKIIDARRGAMASCFSAFKQHFARGQHYSYDLTELGRYYRDYVALMAHFDDVLPGFVHRVRYEDMVDDTEGEVRRLLAFCGLAFEPACLRFHETGRAVRTASSEQVRQPIFREGLDQWRHYDAFLGELRGALGVLADGGAAPPPPPDRARPRP